MKDATRFPGTRLNLRNHRSLPARGLLLALVVAAVLLIEPRSLWAQTPGAVRLDGNGNPAGFNYSAQYVSVANDAALNLVGDFTIEMWFKPHSYAGWAHPYEPFYPTTWEALISKGSWLGPAQGHPNEFTILMAPWEGLLNFYINGGYYSATLPSAPLTLDRWYHMALVRTSGVVQFYFDGAPVGAAANVPQDAVNTRDLWIGQSLGFDRYPGSGTQSHQYAFDGVIDEVRIWNDARTQAEVLAGMNSEPCDPTGLVAYFQFENGSLASSVGAFAGTAVNGVWWDAGVSAPPSCGDADGDGFLDTEDRFPASNTSPTVVIGTCSSGTPNAQAGGGANFMDLIGAAATASRNHGAFVSSVTQLASGWQSAGLISGRQKGQITACAAQSRTGK